MLLQLASVRAELREHCDPDRNPEAAPIVVVGTRFQHNQFHQLHRSLCWTEAEAWRSISVAEKASNIDSCWCRRRVIHLRTMGFTIDSKHVLLCALVTLLLTYGAFHDKLPHGDTVSAQGRKGLSPQQDVVDVVATQDVTVEAEEMATDVVPEDVDFAQGNADEPEVKAVRELEEDTPPTDDDDAGVDVIIPEPEFSANPFLQQIRENNADAVKKEDAIQDCIAEDGCGTP